MHGEKHNDRLEVLKAKYEGEIEVKERELAALKAKLASIQIIVEESEKLCAPESDPDRYAGKGLTDSVLDALHRLWPAGAKDQRGVTAREIADYLLAHGYRVATLGQSFDITVAVTLQRLSSQRRIEKITVDSSNFYRVQLYKSYFQSFRGTGGAQSS